MRAFMIVVMTAVLGSLSFNAVADDWTATKLRGTVMQLVEGDWVKLERGAAVPDDRVIRTLGGRITLVRGAETIELGPNTQVQIFDREGRRPFTTVRQHFGVVVVEAEVRDVQHFAVQTPYLVAVVKGTRFVVRSGESNSEVVVERGAVAVEDSETGSSVVLGVDQSATASPGEPMEVAGRGVLPAVVDKHGSPVDLVNPAGDEVQGASAGNGDSGKGNGNSSKADNSGTGNGNSGHGNSGHGNSGNGNPGNGNGNGNSGNGNGNSSLSLPDLSLPDLPLL